MPMSNLEEQPKFSEDPEEILEGEEIDEKFSYCGICFETIYQPILKGIWYHKGRGSSRPHSGKKDHEPIEATIFELLYLRFEMYQDRRGHGNFDVYKSRHCKCGNVWFDFLTKNFVLPTGFLGDHFFLNGYMVCKKNEHLRYNGEPDTTELNFPDKQGYCCEKCIKFLRQKKFIKIIKYEGKSRSDLYNKIEWLKK